MFKNLTDFNHVRSGKETFGFYIAYVFLVIIVGAIEGAVLTPLVGLENLVNYIMPTVIFIHLTLCFLILSKKMIHTEFKYIMLSLVAGLLSYYFGALGGMIIVSYLTTIPLKTEEENIEENVEENV